MNALKLIPNPETNFSGFDVDPSDRIAARLRLPSLFGQLVRCEAKLRQVSKAGRRYGPYYINGRRYQRRKCRRSMRLWSRWSFKHNWLAIQIRNCIDVWIEMPEDCNGV